MRGGKKAQAAGPSRRQAVGLALGAIALPIVTPAFGRSVPQAAIPDDTRFMRIAIEEAAKGDYPFGAVIVHNGEVLARGCNLTKKQKDPTAHGEMVAIRTFLANHDPAELKGTTLYTSGESCAMCMGAIIWCGIARVVYGASIAELATKIGQIMITNTEIADKTPFADIGITGGVLAADALKLFA
jgi:tRNA(adenine34) deaminase